MEHYKYIAAEDMICPERFDLISKIKYVENYVQGLHLSFIKEYYLKTIEAFTEGTFIEDGTDQKKSPNDFLLAFNKLIYSIQQTGGVNPQQSLIPVTQEGILDNGAHRTAIAIYFKQNIPVSYVQNKINFNYAFFRKRLLDEQILDWTATEYCKLKENTYLVCIWPRANYEVFYDNIYKLLEKESKIVYEKKIRFTASGFVYFIAQIYSHQNWIGNEKNHFNGAAEKAQNCWKENHPLLSFVIQAESLERVQYIKDHIRNMFDIGNHSIHITDNQKETIAAANILYNENSVNLLNYGTPDKYLKSAEKRQKFKYQVQKSGKSFEHFIIDSSSVLALYGLREAEDIDYLYLYSSEELFDDKNTGCHEDNLKYYGITKDDMILNPGNYLVYDGIKFITLNVLLNFKQNRRERKDLIDCSLIEDFLSHNKSCRMLLLKCQAKISRIIRNIRIGIIHAVKRILTRLGLFEKVKTLLRH